MTEIATILRQEVEREGVISLARFMDLALYCPNLGYYEQEGSRIGRSGDFFTSVSTGSLFGELLAFQFALWRETGTFQEWHLVEAGAHDGQLALDVLRWLREARPKLFARLEYWLVEPSSRRQGWQRAKLDKFAGRIRWVETLPALPKDSVGGVIFCNELLDAFPVHRVAWDKSARKWFEWGVGVSEGQFVWQRLELAGRDWNGELRRAGIEMSDGLGAVLPDGFTIDLCPAAGEWWRTAAEALRQGRLLTFDYGLTADQILAPERSQGTLRAYYRHHGSREVLLKPGDRDLTAHVNFTQLQRAGQAAGLKTDGLYTQEQFLTRVGQVLWEKGATIGAPSPKQVRQFQSLTHPEHLGRAFRVLVQSR